MLLQEKYRGSLLGLAIGDALGVPAEFHERGTFEPISDFRDSEMFPLPAGHWSDDTSMALCLAHSLIEKKGFDPVDQIEKYKNWLEEGYCSSTGKAIGVGNTILRALVTHRRGEVPYVPMHNRPQSDGNGSLMRLTPIALFFRDSPVQAIEYSALSSKVTHGSVLCADACRYYCGLIIGALNGVTKAELLSELYCPIRNFWETDALVVPVERIARGSFKNKQLSEIKGSGYVIESMEAALWAFHNSTTFEAGAILAVNLGDDADTTGAIYGQLAGAFYGYKEIPERWVMGVAKKDEILSVADKLFVGAQKFEVKVRK